jgi:hypothetical protein
MLRTPFLTDLDSRAAVKGSRDPLGIQQIWTRLGRTVVGNLTTVSNSVRDFTTLLVGYYFTEQLAKDLGVGSELSVFLKWEQLAAYSRAHVNNDYSFRGTEKVRKFLSEDSRVVLSDDRSHQILGNQKIYGLWGLYTMPARASGLVDDDPPRLTPRAIEFVEKHYIPLLEKSCGRDAKRICELLSARQSKIDVDRGHAEVVSAVAKLLQRKLSASEKEFYRFHLLLGGPEDSTAGKQERLAELLAPTLNDKNFTWSLKSVAELSKTAQNRGDEWQSLARDLYRIRTSESVLAPVSALFTYILGLDGKPIASLAERISTEWEGGLKTVLPDEFRELRGDLGVTDSLTADRWIAVADALHAGDYEALVHRLIEQNSQVMAARGGSPWVELDSGKLRIRFRDEQGSLPKRASLSSLWRFPYFLDSMWIMADTLKEKHSG